MRRKHQTSAAIIAAIVLAAAAVLVSPRSANARVLFLQDGHETETHESAAGTQDNAEHETGGDQQDATHSGGGESHEDPGLSAAHRIAVNEPPSWYRSVITGVVVLFALAATLGSIAVLTKGPEPEDAGPDHDQSDHGHGH